MASDYSEDKLVQEATAQFLEEELGWNSVMAFDEEVLGIENGTLGRASQEEVILTRPFKAALKRLNPWMTENNLTDALNKMNEFMSSQSLMQINEQKYQYIRDGIPVNRPNPSGELEEVKARIIDFDEPGNNDFTAVRELWIKGAIHTRRADVIGYVNGLPIIFMELKNHDIDVENAYNDNYTDYLDTVKQLFYTNAFLIFSNGEQARIGTIGSKWEFFHEWKRLQEEEDGSLEIETMLRGVCDKKNLLDLLENFIFFDHSDGKIAKIMAKNHQYLGVNRAVEKYRQSKEEQKLFNTAIKDIECQEEDDSRKLGVFWHTQGSGKSYSMAFFAQKIRRKFVGSPTIVVLTDREELNKQISGIFENCGLLGPVKAKKFIAQSGDDLNNKLQGNPSFIFSLIQKFNNPNSKPIYPDHDIILMSDEAHRTQNGIFAENMMQMLPTAYRLGFTGTPLLSSDNITQRTFGSYVSIYDFKRAVDDHATVPLFYENRGEKIQGLQNPEINEEIAAALEEAELDPTQQAKIEKELAKEVAILTAEKRLRLIAQDFAMHYSDLWTSGKAMFVSYNKVTCVRMYNYVQEYWQQEIEEVKSQIKHTTDQQEAQELQRKLTWMEETEMCVVISQEQNEIKTFEKWGLDIKPHRKKMNDRELDKEFKDDDSKFRIVFVCAMWLTGFDVKSLSCLYMDKPMKAHTLMQTIARANRVAEGKENGLIVDYIGIVKALKKALADYTANEGGTKKDPTYNKEELIENVKQIIQEGCKLLSTKNINVQEFIDKKPSGFAKIKFLRKAANAMTESAEIRKTFSTIVTTLVRLWRYLDRQDITKDMKQPKDVLVHIWKEMQVKCKHTDITDLSIAISKIVNDHIEIEDSLGTASTRFDISAIDFDILRKEFAKSDEQKLVLKDILELIKLRLAQMLKANPARINFYEKYQEIIKEYNSEQDRASIEKTFEELLKLSNTLNDEQKRYIREGFDNEEQLSMFDLLFDNELSKEDIKKIKQISVQLLAKIQGMLAEMDHPFDKPATKEKLKTEIRLYLWSELPDSRFSEEYVDHYRDSIYNYISMRYAS